MDVALDATGLTVRKYTNRWLTTDYAARGRDFIKLHAAIEMESQAFVGWHYTLSNTHEVTIAPTLLAKITGRIKRVFADAGYLSQKTCIAVHELGAEPWIRPKKTTVGRKTTGKFVGNKRPHPTYLDMLDAYQANPKAWMQTYHKRSRIESAFAGLKQTLGGGLTAMSLGMQWIELTLRIIAWNLTRKARRYF